MVNKVEEDSNEERTLLDDIYDFGVGKVLLILYLTFFIDWILAMFLLNFYIEWRLRHW